MGLRRFIAVHFSGKSHNTISTLFCTEYLLKNGYLHSMKVPRIGRYEDENTNRGESNMQANGVGGVNASGHLTAPVTQNNAKSTTGQATGSSEGVIVELSNRARIAAAREDGGSHLSNFHAFRHSESPDALNRGVGAYPTHGKKWT